MKKNLVNQIVDQFIAEVTETKLFSGKEVEELKILANRDELANRGKVESYLESATAIIKEENFENKNTNEEE